MQTKTRSPLFYGLGGCLLGFLLMVGVVSVMSILGPLVLPISAESMSNFVNIGSWIAPIGLGIVGYVWGTRRQSDQAQSAQADDTDQEESLEE